MIRFEKRGGRLYVYEARREGQRIVRHYLGTAAQQGEFAASSALEHQERVARRAEDRELLRVSREENAADETQLIELDRLVAEGIAALGLHRPKRGPLRRKRHGREDAAQ